MFMTEWENLGREHKILKFWTEIGLKWAKKYYVRMDETDAYVVAMCKFYARYGTWLTASADLTYSPQSCHALLMDQ